MFNLTLNRILDLVCPRFCICCNSLMDSQSNGYICNNCIKKIQLHNGSCCSICGRLISTTATQEKKICQNCTELQPAFCAGVSLFSFNGIAKNIIHTIKYRKGTFLKNNLLSMIDQLSTHLPLNNAVFVPVPLHFYRHTSRGFNQSEWIAKLLATKKNGIVANLLVRKRNTRTQTSLTKVERLRNVDGAFKLKNGCQISKKCNYVLVDDVYTTGSTLNACAKVLKSAGADFIGIFTLGHG